MIKAFLLNRWTHTLFLLALLVTLLIAGALSHTGWVRTLQYTAFDYYNNKKPRPAGEDVLILDIDDNALLALGQWPWPRTVLADIVEALTAQGARAIVFDGLLAESDRTSPTALSAMPIFQSMPAVRDSLQDLPDHDSVLAAAIAESGIFVSGFTIGRYVEQPATPRLVRPIQGSKPVLDYFRGRAHVFDNAAVFLPVLGEAAAGNGSFIATPERDGIIRRSGLVFSDGRLLYPSLALEAIRVADDPRTSIRLARTPGYNAYASIDTPYRVVVGKDYAVPLENDGKIWIYFRHFDRDKDYLSAHRVLDAQDTEAAARVRDRIVLIGASAEGLKDIRSSALDTYISGVEVHANMVEQILQGAFLIRPEVARGAELLAMWCAGIMIILLAPFVGAVFMGALTAGVIGAAVVLSWHGFASYGILFDPVYPGLCLFTLFVTSTLLTYIRTEAERRRVKQAFGLYISPDFMKELTRDPQRLRLGGETRELTVMFTDIRNFTTISESLSPEALINLMNDFLTPMSDIVMQGRGTIDKYMGDAMMAFWNAPLDDADHARHACLAALAMNRALDQVNETLQKDAMAQGLDAPYLQAGIGINTGWASVGNMGSRQRFAYSAIGDTVNLASRLEGQTKTYDVSILIGEATQAQVPDLATLEIDLIRVKGKTAPVRVFALLGDSGMAGQAAFMSWKTVHEDMVIAYRNGQWAAALTSLQTARFLARAATGMKDTLSGTYDVYEKRLKILQKTPSIKGWDGVYIAETK